MGVPALDKIMLNFRPSSLKRLTREQQEAIMPSLVLLISADVVHDNPSDSSAPLDHTSILLLFVGDIPDDILRPYVIVSLRSHPTWRARLWREQTFILEYEDVYTAYTSSRAANFDLRLLTCPWGTRPLEENIISIGFTCPSLIVDRSVAPHFTRCVEILIDHGTIRHALIPELMYMLSKQDDVKTVAMLLARGYDPNFTHLGWSTLDVAKGDDMRQILIAGGAVSGPGFIGMVVGGLQSMIGFNSSEPNTD